MIQNELVRCPKCRIEFHSKPSKTFLFQHKHKCPKCKKAIQLPGNVPNVTWHIVWIVGLIVLGVAQGKPDPIFAAIFFGPLVIGVLLLGKSKAARNEQEYRSIMSQEGFSRHE